MLSRLLQSSNYFLQITLMLFFAAWIGLNIESPFSAKTIILWAVVLALALFGTIYFQHTPLLRRHSGVLLIYLLVLGAAFQGDLLITGIVLVVYVFLTEALNLFGEAEDEVSYFSLGLYFFAIVLLKPILVWYMPFLLLVVVSSKLSYANHFGRFLMGILLPGLLVGQLIFVFDLWPAVSLHLQSAYAFQWPKLNNSLYFLIPIGLLLLLALSSHMKNSPFQKQSKKTQTDLLYLFLLNTMILAFFRSADLAFILSLLAFPLAIILGRYWQYHQKLFWKELTIWALLFCWLMYWFSANGY